MILTAGRRTRICDWFDHAGYPGDQCWAAPEVQLTIFFGKDLPEATLGLCRKIVSFIQHDIRDAVESLDARDAYSGGTT